MRMKPEHKRFAQLVRDGMGKKAAAVEVGYSETSAGNQATLMLKRPEVQEIINGGTVEEFEDAGIKAGINARYVLSEILDNAQKAKAGDEERGLKPDYKASTAAFALLGKHLRLFIDIVETKDVTKVLEFLDKIINIIDEEVRDPAIRARLIVRLGDLKETFE